MTNFNFTYERQQSPVYYDVNFNFGTDVGEGAYRILAGQSSSISAIWASPTASRTSGKMYVASTGVGAAFSIVDLETRMLYDRYTTTIKGRANETLSQNDPTDVII